MKRFYFLAASIGLLAACSGLEQPEQNLFNTDGDLVEKVIFEVLPIKDGDDPATRASAVPNGGTVGFVWEATDTVGIYPDKGSQVYFNIEDGVGTSSVSFTGGGWALKQNSTYVSYYPFLGDIYMKRDEIPVSFAGQKQIGTRSPFVGARYYLATGASTSENGVLRFSYSTLNTIINVNAKLPAGTYTKMSLTTEEPLFVEEGTYSLDDHVIVGTKFTSTLEIELEDVVLTEEGTIPIYIMSAPVDLKDKQVTVMIMTSDGKGFKCVKTPSKAYAAGTRYGLTCDKMESVSQPNNVIYYSSSDGQIVTPNKTNVFGANIVSNEYIDGQGIITFDGDVTSIGGNAFSNNSSLTSIFIPASVTSIGDAAFYSCRSLMSINILEGVTSIGEWAFSGCSSLGSITIPDSVISVGNGAFRHCFTLKSFNGKYASSDGLYLVCQGSINAIAYGAINGSITIPYGVTKIDSWVFSNCTGLTSITIPESVTSIGEAAFAGCTSLVAFHGHYASSDGLFLIDQGRAIAVAYGAINGSFTIPDSITSISSSLFAICNSLTSVTIPSSVTNIGSLAFEFCSSLTMITVLSEVPPSGGNMMFSYTNDCPIYVPAGSLEVYKTAEYWSEYADRIFSTEGGIVPGAEDGGDD